MQAVERAKPISGGGSFKILYSDFWKGGNYAQYTINFKKNCFYAVIADMNDSGKISYSIDSQDNVKLLHNVDNRPPFSGIKVFQAINDASITYTFSSGYSTSARNFTVLEFN